MTFKVVKKEELKILRMADEVRFRYEKTPTPGAYY